MKNFKIVFLLFFSGLVSPIFAADATSAATNTSSSSSTSSRDGSLSRDASPEGAQSQTSLESKSGNQSGVPTSSDSDDEQEQKAVKAPKSANIKVSMNVAKRDTSPVNCGVYAIANARRFFDSKGFALDAEYQKIVGNIKQQFNGPAFPVEIIAALSAANLANDPFLIVTDQQSLAFDDSDAVDAVSGLAQIFRETGSPVGIILQIVAGNYAHWVFVGITKTEQGIDVVIPETAMNDYVTPQLPFINSKILTHFE